LARIGLFVEGFCHNPKFIIRSKFVLVAPSRISKRQKIEYSPREWMALLTKKHQVEECFSTIPSTKEGVSNPHSRRNQIVQ
jgi:hypothetical protein